MSEVPLQAVSGADLQGGGLDGEVGAETHAVFSLTRSPSHSNTLSHSAGWTTASPCSQRESTSLGPGFCESVLARKRTCRAEASMARSALTAALSTAMSSDEGTP